MKKYILKQELLQATIKASLYEQSCDVLVSELKEMREALDRRRQLCKTMEELVNRNQPKSMEEMVQSMFEIFKHPATSWDGERPEEKDKWMDALLKIIG